MTYNTVVFLNFLVFGIAHGALRDICGDATIVSPRSSGSHDAHPSDFPWLLQIRFESKPETSRYCAGSIIDNHWVLTVASCFSGTNTTRPGFLESIEMSKGNVRQPGSTSEEEEESEEPELFEVEEILIHPNFNKTNFINDFALIKTAEPFDFSKPKVYSPICLAENCDFERHTMCIQGGWGSDRLYDNITAFTADRNRTQRAEMNKYLKKTFNFVQNNSFCQAEMSRKPEWNNRIHTISPAMTCSGFTDGNWDDCLTDAGGPLMCTPRHTLRYFVQGMSSWGFGCSRSAGYYRVHSRPCVVVDWIKKVTNKTYGLPPVVPTTPYRPREGTENPVTSRKTTTQQVAPSALGGCGRLYRNRIAGTEKRGIAIENIGQAPWHVRIDKSPKGQPFTKFCSGALIASQWILTSNDCLKSLSNSTEGRVYVGTNEKSKAGLQSAGYAIESVRGLRDHELGLLQLRDRIPTDGITVGHLCLPSSRFSRNLTCSVSGWGDIRRSNCQAGETLRYGIVEMYQFSNERNKPSYRARSVTPACNDFDIGAALACTENNGRSYQIYGIVSLNSTAQELVVESVEHIKDRLRAMTTSRDEDSF